MRCEGRIDKNLESLKGQASSMNLAACLGICGERRLRAANRTPVPNSSPTLRELMFTRHARTKHHLVIISPEIQCVSVMLNTLQISYFA